MLGCEHSEEGCQDTGANTSGTLNIYLFVTHGVRTWTTAIGKNGHGYCTCPDDWQSIGHEIDLRQRRQSFTPNCTCIDRGDKLPIHALAVLSMRILRHTFVTMMGLEAIPWYPIPLHSL